MDLNYDRLNKYKTTYGTRIKIDKQYLRIEGQLEKNGLLQV